jgi:hypothetical protein
MQRLPSAVSAEHQGNFQSDDRFLRKETLNLPARDYSLNEARDKLKKSKWRISDRENNNADSGDG